MLRNTNLCVAIVGFAALAVGGIGPALATQPENVTYATNNTQLEEVVVIVNRPEQLRQEERRRMDRLRQQLLEDFSENQLLEKRNNLREQHRQQEQSSSTNWGFDAERDRRNYHLSGGDALPWPDINPATFFSVSF